MRPVPSVDAVAGDADHVARARALQPLIRVHADEAEREARLPNRVARALAEAGLFRLAAPRQWGGADVDPMTQVRVIETVSEADGSSGWNLMIGIESFGLIAPTFTGCPELIADPATILASSTANVGRAERVAGGFLVTGEWQFVSGCHNAHLFAGTVAFYENGEPMPDRPARGYAVVEPGEFGIVETWNVSGLRGSGSHDVRVDRVFVPDARILGTLGTARGQSPLLNIPLGSRLAYNKVGVSLGIARAAIDAFVDLATGKLPRFSQRRLAERPSAQRALAEAEIGLRAARALVFERIEALWVYAVRGEQIPAVDRALLQGACSHAARACVDAVDRVAEAAGTSANDVALPLARLVRDVRVVPQHFTVASHHLDDVGRVLLDLEAESPMLGSGSAFQASIRPR